MDMDVCRNNVSVSSSECQQELLPTLDDLFSHQNTEVDIGMEWLSVFVEDCFSSRPSCQLLAPPGGGGVQIQTTTSTSTSNKPLQRAVVVPPQQSQCPNMQNFAVPGRARSKRKRLSAPRTRPWSQKHFSTQINDDGLSSCSDYPPPLLKQAYWLADSELIVPEKKEVVEEENEGEGGEVSNNNEEQQKGIIIPRRCTHCMSQRTPQWRAGPLGPKSLCNACGVRYKSGRLLPEYRPAKSPTFVSFLHSNSHKKVMEIRMATDNNK